MTEQPSLFPETQAAPARVIDRRRWPAGVVPRHLQQWVLLGVAVVMVAILALSGPPAKPRASTLPSPASVAVDPNQQRIEDYQRRIQEQAQRLAAEQASLQAAKAALGGISPSEQTPGVGAPPPRLDTGDGVPPAAPVARESHEDRARFADNVAFSRASSGQGAPTVVPMPAVAAPASTDAAVAALLPPGWPGAPPPVTGASTPLSLPATPPAVPPAVAAAPTSPSNTSAPRYRLFEGTVIETVLTNRLDGTFTGPVNCLVSVPVYAAEHLVIPAGARVLGEARAVNTFGQSRLAVTFHRLLLPNGASITLDGFQGLNQAGDLGLRDQADRHYGQIFGVSLALGAIAGFSQASSTVGLASTGVDAYRQGVASSVSQSSTRVLDRFLNLLPTVTIREGHRIKVYLSADLELPAFVAALSTSGGRP